VTPRGRSRFLIAGLAAWLVLAAPAAAGVLIRAPSYVNLSAQARTWRLTDSSWGFISPLSQAVAAELETCKKGDPAILPPLHMSPNRLAKSPAEALTAEFGSGQSAEAICARSIRELRQAGARHLYVSNLPTRGTRQTLERILSLV